MRQNKGGANNLGSTGVDLKADGDARITTLDAVWERELGREHIYMIKIDIEGYEARAWEGAKKMLAQAPPLVIYMVR